jgi:hypothetical protein
VELKKVGARVKVRHRHRKPELRGRPGTVVRRWGAPSYGVLEVRMDDGRRKLFWEHELAPADGFLRAWLPMPFYDGS